MFPYSVLCLLVMNHISYSVEQEAQTSFYFDLVQSCPDETNVTMNFTRIQIVNLGRGKTAIDGNMMVYEDIVGPLKATLIVQKCQGRQEPCEYFGTYKAPSLCGKLLAKNQFWTPFMSSFSPKFACPIAKNDFAVQNGTLDANILLHMPGIPGHYWKMKVLIMSKKTLVSCTDIEGELHHIPPPRKRTG